MRATGPRPSACRAFLLVGLLIVGACSSETPADEPAADSSPAGPVADVVEGLAALRPQTLGEASPVLSSQTLLDRLGNGLRPLPNAPVFEGDYADPFVLEVGPALILYTTNTTEENVPVLISAAGVVGVPAGDALPDLPSWTEPGLVWAPSVLERDGSYVLYYTSKETDSGLQCIGAARSDRPAGPFVDESDAPFVCQRDLGGSIDASPFVASDGTLWLLYKNDGNCCDLATELWIQQLRPDGSDLVGDPVSLLATTEDWEGSLVEGPSMIEGEGMFWLFYSANRWDTADYSIGVARCETVVGPCEKFDGPWLAGHGEATGPGGPEQFTDQFGDRWIVYHAWVTDTIGYENGGARALFAQPLDFGDGWPIPAGMDEG